MFIDYAKEFGMVWGFGFLRAKNHLTAAFAICYPMPARLVS